MKILFLGYPDASLIGFLNGSGETVTVVSPDEPVCAEFVQSQSFDFLVSYGYRRILRKELLNLFPRRAINLHIAYLPWNRGYDPNFWSFLEGTPKGVSIHYLDEGIDTGDLIVQKEVFFSEDETLQTSYNQLRVVLETLFFKHWASIRCGDCVARKQPAGGNFHMRKDRRSFEALLTKGMDTPVQVLIEYGRRNLR